MLLKVRMIFVQVGVGVEGAKCRSDSLCPGTACQKELIAQIKLLNMEEEEREGKEEQHIYSQSRDVWCSGSRNSSQDLI